MAESGQGLGGSNPLGGPRTFHQKSISLHVIDLSALRGANLVTLLPKFGVLETFVVHRVERSRCTGGVPRS